MRAVAISGGAVLDASAALAWFFEDELDDLAHAMAREVAAKGAFVPAIFWLEMQNAFLQAFRRKRMSRDMVDVHFDDLNDLNITVDEPRPARLKAGFALAQRFGLSAYDIAYLELAVRAKSPIMTRDKRLVEASRELNVLWGPPASKKE